MSRTPADQGLWAIFRWPLCVALLSLAGLLAALLGDGAWDWLGVLMLLPSLGLGLHALARAGMKR